MGWFWAGYTRGVAEAYPQNLEYYLVKSRIFVTNLGNFDFSQIAPKVVEKSLC